MKWFLCWSLFFSMSLVARETKMVLITYPRSGTNWFLHCITTLMKDPTTPDTSPSKVQRLENYHSFEIIEAMTGAPWTHTFAPKKDKIIMLIRNYKECMLRHFNGDPLIVIDHLTNDEPYPKQLRFFSNLQHFELWPENNRLLIYYEDLLTDPEQVLTNALVFLDLPLTHLEHFLENIEAEQTKMRSQYNEAHERTHLPGVGSQSEGKDLLYHSKKVPEALLTTMESIAYQRAPKLYQKYLKRYDF